MSFLLFAAYIQCTSIFHHFHLVTCELYGNAGVRVHDCQQLFLKKEQEPGAEEYVLYTGVDKCTLLP